MRIGGLASGIDTESIINDMMRAHRIPLNKITQKKQYAEWQLDDYRSVNRDIRSMRDDLFDMTRQSTYMAKTVSVSNENAVGMRALSASSELTGEIEIEQLAKAASWQSAEKKGLTQDSKMSELLGNNEDGEITIAFHDVGEDGKSIGDALSSKAISYEAGDSIETIINKINKDPDAGVTAFFDEHTGKIAMTARNSGEKAITVDGLGDTSTQTAGQNAKFTFNGLKTERESNTFEINGFEITLKEKTKEGAPVTFSSAPDVDKVFDAVKSFVDDYNKLIEDLNSKLREPLHRDYHPLSEEEKAEMKEREIELWEEKAMSGTLRNDPTIQSLLQKMRLTLSNGVSDGQVDENGKTGRIVLSEIGITTSKDFLANGKLEIDEDKLREAITADPNKIYDLLGKSSGPDDEKGLVPRLRDAMKEANDTISRRAGNAGAANESFTLGRNIKEMDNQIERFEERMQKMEERYWREFTAMEQAMSRAQSQAEQMMNALGGGMM